MKKLKLNPFLGKLGGDSEPVDGEGGGGEVGRCGDDAGQGRRLHRPHRHEVPHQVNIDSNLCLTLRETNPGMGSQSPRGELCGKPSLTIESEE